MPTPAEDVLSITWYPGRLGGRSGITRVVHLDGREHRRTMDRLQAEAFATRHFGPDRVEHHLPAGGVEWSRPPG